MASETRAQIDTMKGPILAALNTRDSSSGCTEATMAARVADACTTPGHAEAGAKEAAAYIPTARELVQLVKYWYRRRLDTMWFYFCYGQSGNDMSATLCCADFRISLAAEVIGWEAVHQAITGVREEFRAEVRPRPALDARLWDIFENGTPEQWAAEQDKFWREFGAKESQTA